MSLSVLSSVASATGASPPISLLRVASLAETSSLREALQVLSQVSGYQVYFTSVHCSEENEFWADEIYAIFVACGWGPENAFVPWAKVTYTKVFTDVDAGETHGANRSSDDTWLWGSSTKYKAMDPDRSLILVQAMEEDLADRKVIKKALQKVMPARLRMLLAGNASRSKLVEEMKKQMRITIDATRCADAGLVPDDLFDAIDDFANFPQQAVLDAVDFLVGKELRDLLKLGIRAGLGDALAELDVWDGEPPDPVGLIIGELSAELEVRLHKGIKDALGEHVADVVVNDILGTIIELGGTALTGGNVTLEPSAGGQWSDLRADLEAELAGAFVDGMLSTITDLVMSAIPGVNVANLLGEAIDVVTDILQYMLEDCDDRVGSPKELEVQTLLGTQRPKLTFSGNGEYEYRFSIKGEALPMVEVQPVPSLSP